MTIAYTHNQGAHCETAVTMGLIAHRGVRITESLTFGIGSGLFFVHLPFVKFMDLPLTAFRSFSGTIFKRSTQRLGIGTQVTTFRNPQKGMDALDRLLDQGIPVGLQAGIYWLPYFWPAFRMHINLHNLVVFGKEDGDYLISDPAMSTPVKCPAKDLQAARFAKGLLAPKGKMYHLTHVPETLDYPAAAVKGIEGVCHVMLKVPMPFLGVRGIRFLANRLERWPDSLGERKSILYLAQIVRMLEEIGTGGAGFRFMFAAFLQEAAAILGEERLLGISQKLTDTGDQWRAFASQGARCCKGRAKEGDSFPALAALMRDCGRREGEIYAELAGVAAVHARRLRL